MTPEEVKARIGSIPYMTLREGERITEFIRQHNLKDVLELGFCYGTSTCYLAAAVDSMGGTLTTVDHVRSRALRPDINDLLRMCDLETPVEIYFEPTSYTWRLMRFIEDAGRFDLCFVDGAHDWFTDGFAFFLVDKLLKPGGWIIFDDISWSFNISPSHRSLTKDMPEDERTTPQIERVWELLVKPHPSYSNFMVRDGWAYAQKVNEYREWKTETVYVGARPILMNLLRRLLK